MQNQKVQNNLNSQKKKREIGKVEFLGEPIFAADAERMKFSHIKPVRILVFSNGISIENEKNIKKYRNEDIVGVIPNGKTRIEIYILDGTSYLLDFDKVCDPNVMRILKAKKQSDSEFVEAWNSKLISNFQFLIMLNRNRDHSFNDNSTYPIFPRVMDNIDFPTQIYDFANSISKSIPLSRIMMPHTCIYEDISETIKKSLVLPPEFYFMPDVFVESDRLPKWAHNSFQVIYEFRKLLESPVTTRLLPLWIKSTFGLSLPQKNEQVVLNNNSKFNQNVIDGGCLKEISDKIRHISFVDNDKISINTNPIQNSGQNPNNQSPKSFAQTNGTLVILRNGKIIINGALKDVRIPDDFIADSGYCEDSLCSFYSPSSKSLYTFQGSNIQVAKNQDVKFFAKVGDLGIITCPTECSLVFDVIPELRIQETRGRITKLTARRSSKLVAVSTTDGEILVYSTNGKLQTSFTVNSTIDEILITECWGLIVVRTLNELIITNPFGNEVGRSVFPKSNERVKKLFTFHGKHGFDYLVTESENFSLDMIEAGKPQSGFVHLSDERTHCVGIKYDYTIDGLEIVLDNGIIRKIPHLNL